MIAATTSPVWPALKRGYALGTGLVGALSMVVCGVVTAVLGGDGQAIVIASVALLLGVVISLSPAILGLKPEVFGMAVLASSMARMIVCLGIVVVAASAMDLPRRPIGLGVGSGLLLALIAEVMLALSVLSRVDRKSETA